MKWCDRKELDRGLADAVWDVISRLDTAEREFRLEQFKREHGGG